MMADNRIEWLEARKTGIGGSDVAAVLGLSPWRTPLDVYYDKIGVSPETEVNDAMYWGTKLEALVAARYCEETGFEVRRVNSILRSEKFTCLIGNIDRAVVLEKGKMPVVNGEFRTPKILECKTARSKTDEWGDFGTDFVPDYYLIQCLHYLGLTGCESCDLAVLFMDSRKFGIYTIKRNAEVIEGLQARIAAWWDKHVVARKEPMPRTLDEAAKLWRRSEAKTISATEEIEELMRAYAQIQNTAKEVEEAMAATKDKLVCYMGECDTLTGADGKILATWKSRADFQKTDWEAVARAAGATEAQIAANTKTVTGSRTFLNKVRVAPPIEGALPLTATATQ